MLWATFSRETCGSYLYRKFSRKEGGHIQSSTAALDPWYNWCLQLSMLLVRISKLLWSAVDVAICFIGKNVLLNKLHRKGLNIVWTYPIHVPAPGVKWYHTQLSVTKYLQFCPWERFINTYFITWMVFVSCEWFMNCD